MHQLPARSTDPTADGDPRLRSAMQQHYSVLYTKHLTRKSKIYIDGFLSVRPDRLATLTAEDGAVIGTARLPTSVALDDEPQGLACFDGFLVNVDCTCDASAVPGRPCADAAAPAAAERRPLASGASAINRTSLLLPAAQPSSKRGFRPPSKVASGRDAGGVAGGSSTTQTTPLSSSHPVRAPASARLPSTVPPAAGNRLPSLHPNQARLPPRLGTSTPASHLAPPQAQPACFRKAGQSLPPAAKLHASATRSHPPCLSPSTHRPALASWMPWQRRAGTPRHII